MPASSTSTGEVQPHSRTDAAIWAICSSEWVRALRAYGRREATGRRATESAGHPREGPATGAGFSAVRRVLAVSAVIIALCAEARKRAVFLGY